MRTRQPTLLRNSLMPLYSSNSKYPTSKPTPAQPSWLSGQPSSKPMYNNSSNSTNNEVFIKLWDLFGDTWNGAQWHLERPNGHIESYSLELDQSPYNVYIHDLSNKSAQEGLYYMTVQTPDESMPAEWWEVSAINH